MESFSALLVLCVENSSVTDEFPSQRPVARIFDVFLLIYAWTNGWVNDRVASDLRRHLAHNDVTVMSSCAAAPQRFRQDRNSSKCTQFEINKKLSGEEVKNETKIIK